MTLDRRYIWGAFGVLCALAMIVAGCGEESPTKVERKSLNGKVIVRNDTESELTVEYFHSEQGEVKVTVQANEIKDISPAPLEAGTKLTVEITALTATDIANTNAPRTEVPVEINGSVTIRIIRVEGSEVYSGLIDWEIVGA